MSPSPASQHHYKGERATAGEAEPRIVNEARWWFTHYLPRMRGPSQGRGGLGPHKRNCLGLVQRRCWSL